jgi:hypothetical protein
MPTAWGTNEKNEAAKFCVVDSLSLSCCCLQLLSSRIRRSPLSVAIERESGSTKSKKEETDGYVFV